MLPPIQTVPATSQRAEPQTRLDLNRIRSAIPRIAPVFRNTPQYMCPSLSEALNCEVTVKLETVNPVRCFKARGTETVMARLVDNPGSTSAVCASVGNLGLALAYSGQSRGISVTVVAGASANPYKLERIRALGATVRIVDGDFDDARHLARQMADTEGAFLVEDSENLDTCEGAGTIGLELIEDEGPVDAVGLNDRFGPPGQRHRRRASWLHANDLDHWGQAFEDITHARRHRAAPESYEHGADRGRRRRLRSAPRQ